MQQVSRIPLEVGIRSEYNPDFTKGMNTDQWEIVAYQLETDPSQIVTLALMIDPFGFSLESKEHAERVANSILQVFDQAEPPYHWLELFKAGFLSAQEQLAPYELAAVSCSAALITDNHLFIASYGTTRILLISQGQAKQLSSVHEMIELLIRGGSLTVDDLKNRVENRAFKYLGDGQLEGCPDLRLQGDGLTWTEQETTGIELFPGDQVILCNDHVFGVYLDPTNQYNSRWQQFHDAFINNNPLQEKVSQFIEDIRREAENHVIHTVLALRVPSK